MRNVDFQTKVSQKTENQRIEKKDPSPKINKHEMYKLENVKKNCKDLIQNCTLCSAISVSS